MWVKDEPIMIITHKGGVARIQAQSVNLTNWKLEGTQLLSLFPIKKSSFTSMIVHEHECFNTLKNT